MKLQIHSIQFRLLSIGLLSVLLPLLVVGFFSVSKSSDALMTLSQEKAQIMAGDHGNRSRDCCKPGKAAPERH